MLLGLKVFLALATGSLGVLSEALHSGLDLIAAILTWLSVRVSDRPADSGHTYGHGKFESFSAFVRNRIAARRLHYFEAFERLLFKQVRLQPSVLAIVILFVAMGIDIVRSRALTKVAREHPSDALEADALHFSTDVWSTLVVILGMGAVWLGQYTGMEWLRNADPIAALVVAAIVIWVGSRLGKRTMDALLDVAPAGLQERVIKVQGLDGVLDGTSGAGGKPAFRGCHHQRSAGGQLRAGARHQRRGRAARGGDYSRRRDGSLKEPDSRGTTIDAIRAIAARRRPSVQFPRINWTVGYSEMPGIRNN